MFLSAALKQRRRHAPSASAATLVAAAGGFEANIEWLKQYWGEAADNFLIRGTPYNRGSILKMLLAKGVQEIGDPTQCHAVAIDARAPKFDGGIITRHDSVVFGIVVNKQRPALLRRGRGHLAEALRDLGPAGRGPTRPDRLHHLRLQRGDELHADAVSADRGRDHRRARRQARARSGGAGEDRRRIQRRGAARHLRSHHPRRLPHRRHHAAEDALGAAESRRRLISPIRCGPASPSPISARA